MNRDNLATNSVFRIIQEALTTGFRVDIDGFGSFIPNSRGGFDFLSRSRIRVFIAYVTEDAARAERLYDDLVDWGFDPWMDRRKLLPGQNWPRAIEDAIRVADYFIACFSGNSIRKRGGFQSEIRYALDCTQRLPLDEVFLIPVRFDDCAVPAQIRDQVQYVDLFPSWESGFRRILHLLRGARVGALPGTDRILLERKPHDENP